MEISPRELRDIEIREAFRGYHRDDVNELLERAAATIEALTDRVRELGDRLATAPAAGSTRTRDLEEMLERTLLLAKRTADEEVAEAQAKARQLVDDAEAKARKLLLDAEVDARRRAEEERGKIQRELVDLSNRRDVLAGSVVELERFESEYRERLLRSIEADLAVISGRSPSAPGPRPEIPLVEVPPLPEAVMRRSEPDDSGTEPAADPAATPEDRQPDGEARALVEAAAAQAAARHEAEMRAHEPEPAPAFDDVLPREARARHDPVPERPLGERASRAPRAEARAARDGQIDLLGEESVDAEADDDAFFAQLRDAVSDDRPLSPAETSFFDQELDDTAQREMFRRRR
jgi:DivIVA domain-containing protein